MVAWLRVAGLLVVVAVAAAQDCSLTSRPPTKARYLKFCQDYNAEACCIPGHDLENQVQFENVIDGLGPGCKNPMMYPELRYFYCLGCDPWQPRYTNDTANTIRVCKDFVDRLWSDPAYVDCGVMYPNPCPSNWVDDGMDPYTCGDDLLLPKSDSSWADTTGQPAYKSDGTTSNMDERGILFMNVFKPPGLDDFTFVEIPNCIAGNEATYQAHAAYALDPRPVYEPRSTGNCGAGYYLVNPDTECWNAKAFRTSGAARLGSASGMAIMLLGMALPAMAQRLR